MVLAQSHKAHQQTASEDVASQQLLPSLQPPPKLVSGDTGSGGRAKTVSSWAILAVVSAVMLNCRSVTLDLNILTSEMAQQPHSIPKQHG